VGLSLDAQAHQQRRASGRIRFAAHDQIEGRGGFFDRE
jgi:hypothetical protein